MNAADLEAEREALIAEIYAAFKDVSREGGVSWRETRVIDDAYDLASEKTAAARAQARALDMDRHWTELAETDDWLEDLGRGSFSFLDPIGFRYYLPAVMVLCARTGHGYQNAELAFKLQLGPAWHYGTPRPDPDALSPGDQESKAWTIQCWSLLTDRQRRCVARFLRYMIALCESDDGDFIDAHYWRAAYESYWKSFE